MNQGKWLMNESCKDNGANVLNRESVINEQLEEENAETHKSEKKHVVENSLVLKEHSTEVVKASDAGRTEESMCRETEKCAVMDGDSQKSLSCVKRTEPGSDNRYERRNGP